MQAKLFTQMLSDKSFLNLRKLEYKYSKENVAEMISLLKESMYKKLSVQDFSGEQLVYLENIVQISMSGMRRLLTPQSSCAYGINAMEEEIHSSLSIESISSTRTSIRKILNGFSPQDDSEQRIYAMKKGLDFISDTKNTISEENLHKLYMLTIGNSLPKDDKLLSENFYRHDSVFIVGSEIEHKGLPAQKLNAYMSRLIAFISEDSPMNDLLKAAAIHFYVAYLHPYFDGNGRIARLIHLWYLVQHGYPNAMFVPFSKYVSDSKKAYYAAYTQIENNLHISGVVDVTPFLTYFIENVYNKL